MRNKLLNVVMLGFLLAIPTINFAQAPSLGTAATFVLFTSTGAVGNTGQSHLTGNVGSNNGSSTGFGNVNGVMHNNNGATAAAASDLLLAYNQLNATISTDAHAPLLGNGDTLTAGVYAVPANAVLNLNLNLDAQNNPNAVFIFQINGTLSTNVASEIVLLNGAKACNIFWKVEGAVSMATATKMKGNVIANNAAISLGTDVELEGRALSTTGAVSVSGVLAYTPIGCGSPVHTGPMAPTLGAVGGYAIFSGNGGVVNSGISTILGEVGTNVGLTTGYDSLTVSCEIHPIPDTSTASAAADLVTVYNYLNSLTPDIELLYPAQFGNSLVLTPHTYIMNGAVTFTDSLYLNAEGDSNAVFVIQVFGAFSTSTFASVNLMNGAKAENVYWNINGALTINDYSKMVGTFVVNNGAIIVNTGAEIDGRVLTTDGAVSTFSISTTMQNMPCGGGGSTPPPVPGSALLTINQTAPATATNFLTFQDAATYLNTMGVTEATEIDVVAGTGPYVGQFLLSEIPGSSAINTVIINGHGNSLTMCSGSSSSRAMVRLDGTDNITINNLVLSGTCNFGWGIHMMNGNENVTLSNNTIHLSSAFSIYAGNMQGIVASNSITDPAAAAGVLSNITITGNTINNGYQGIRMNGNPTTVAENMTISGNILNNPAAFGLLVSYADGITIDKNYVEMKNVDPSQDIRSTGIYLVSIENLLSVQGNSVIDAGHFGMWLNYVNRNTTTRSLVANNMIGGGFRNENTMAIQLNSASRLDFYNNSVNADYGTTGLGLYVSNRHSVELNVVNNSFAYTGNGANARAFYAGDAFYNFDTIDYNNYYSTGGYFVHFNRGARANLAELQASTNNGVGVHDMNSMQANPSYVSPTNLHLNGASPLSGMGMQLASVMYDFDEDIRTATPTIGADELVTGPARFAAKDLTVAVYPNPFKDALTIDVATLKGNVQVTLTDLMGRQIYNQTSTAQAGILTVTPEANLSQGVYMLQVTNNGSTGVYRVVKQ